MKTDIKLCECECGKPAPISTYTSRRVGIIKGYPTRFINGHQNRGKNNSGYKHGLNGHPLVKVLDGIKTRCYNFRQPGFKYYYDRNISVCDEWRKNTKSFVLWGIANGWRPGLVIDRKDNDGNYNPGNCRFVTYSISNRNRRKMEKTTARYIGISWNKLARKFTTYISINKKFIYLGRHKTEIGAVLIRDRYIIKNKLKVFKTQILNRGEK